MFSRRSAASVTSAKWSKDDLEREQRIIVALRAQTRAAVREAAKTDKLVADFAETRRQIRAARLAEG